MLTRPTADARQVVFVFRLFYVIALHHDAQDGLFARLLQLTRHQKLIQHLVCFLEVEDEIELPQSCTYESAARE